MTRTTVFRPMLLAALTALFTIPSSTFAQSAVKLQGGGDIHLSSEGPATFTLSGTASHLGKYTCVGELALDFDEDGSATGTGVAAFRAANGDILVGVVTIEFDTDGTGNVHFSWRDSVTFHDGTVIRTTGRFVASRPPGAISPFIFEPNTNIIAILIGLFR
jgi:ABC-type transport system substrate-binding protein